MNLWTCMADVLLRQRSVSLLPDSSSPLLPEATFLSFLGFNDEKVIALPPSDGKRGAMIVQSSERRMCRGGDGDAGRA